MRKRLFIALSAVVLLIAAAVGGIYWSKRNTFAVPDGWKEYRNERLGISFVYPGNWDTLDVAQYNEIWINNGDIPEPPPPDMLFLPMVVAVTKESSQKTFERLSQQANSSFVEIAGRQISRLSFVSGPDKEARILYIMSRSNDYLHIGIPVNRENTPEIQQILESLVQRSSR
ncbi:hypothetical protein HYT45_01190 [Candidatus Uhrbacteria bacterium]|nr:hypothetical protein [Candidatus Uhrbacteria bacterium]